jgi:broad specificity phosphatase PhoE
MKIYYVRHGETVWNREQRLQGQKDSPLTLRGVELAIGYGNWLADRLRDARDVAFFASPLGRTRQTATIIADCIGHDASEIQLDPLLGEHDVGAFEGMTWEEIGTEHGVTREDWQDWHFRGHGGEARIDVLSRARRWLSMQRAHQTVVVVSHGGFSRAFRAAYLKLDAASAVELDRHDHGKLFCFEAGRCNEHIIDGRAPRAEAPLG